MQLPRGFAIGLAYLSAYVGLDWLSFVYEFSIVGITPWNPPPGASLAVLLQFGLRYAPWLPAAAMVADLIVRGLPSSFAIAAGSALAIGAGYTVAALVLRRYCQFDAALARLRDVVALLAVAVVASLAVAATSVGLFTLGGHVSSADFASAALRFWVGDFIGIATLTPLLLRIANRSAIAPSAGAGGLETAAQALSIVLALWVVFGVESTDEFKFFYLLFLPIIWIALRRGLDGAAVAVLAMQVGLLWLAEQRGFGATTVTEFQILLAVLATTGLLIGAVVSARWRTDQALRDSEGRLRQRQAELAHVSRLTMMGGMASALAHELNQPLTAIRAYARAFQVMLRRQPPDVAGALANMDDAVRQADHAGEIIRRLRDFLRRGEVLMERAPIQPIILEMIEFVAAEARQRGIGLRAEIAPGLPEAMIDRVQIGQVLLNLLRNAIDAMAAAERATGSVAVLASAADPGSIEVTVADDGTGIAAEVRETLFKPFTTSKAEGMGLGLAICQSIVEAHGGRLRLDRSDDRGTVFKFTVPTAPPSRADQ